MKIKIVFFFLVTILSINTFAQENEQEKKNLLSVALGYTYIPNESEVHIEEATAVFIPTFGLDYFRRLSSHFEIGLMADVELGEYLIIDKDLHRENAFLLVAMLNYNLTKHINILGGGGMEFEKNKNLGVVRLGAEYVFKLKKEWVILPGFFYDFKEGTDTWALSIGIGKEF